MDVSDILNLRFQVNNSIFERRLLWRGVGCADYTADICSCVYQFGQKLGHKAFIVSLGKYLTIIIHGRAFAAAVMFG